VISPGESPLLFLCPVSCPWCFPWLCRLDLAELGELDDVEEVEELDEELLEVAFFRIIGQTKRYPR
jgi:hypothetical protein